VIESGPVEPAVIEDPKVIEMRERRRAALRDQVK
jgi:hypothetical protein